ncbi:hypothetical protein GCM10025867_51380 (plasmid) [Frondihabitans sucicola]|uniref:Uncharacterized protein n=1 Tax=Frondihabitans sucicola TaxID=1268041 RepID=A0ABM8GVC5_9MICO|nr:hypothetical protein [Frondihabitans sucicola]BDZ52330.1 hypothetical protein GCM10025867_45710 [Frondihabitans sucicola]BDZ52897.1 hypothetical protein GCM10025867_51380 [Frondihabitans sucicola]
MQTTDKPLTEQTPAEIDRQLSAIYVKRTVLGSLIANEGRRIEIAEDSIAADEIAGRTERIGADLDRIAGFRATLADLELQRAVLGIDEEPLEAEFTRRGGWTRAFIVNGGHVHSSRSCTSCFPTTRFTWLTNLSDRPEAEIVQGAGERACTICYPTAPVDVLRQASVVFSDEERAEHEARARRHAAAAALDGKKPDNKLTHPRGEVVVDRWGRPAKTEKDAVSAAISAIYDGFYLPIAYASWKRPAYVGSDEEARNKEIIRIAIQALARKHRTDDQLQLDILTAKAIAQFIRLNRGSLDAKLLELDLRVLKARIKLAQG